MKLKRQIKEVLLIGFSAVLLAGCGSRGETASEAVNGYAVSEDKASAGAFSAYDAEVGFSADYEDEAGYVSDGEGDLTDISVPADENRKLVRTVSIEMEVKDFDAAVSGIKSGVASAGGYIESSGMSGKADYSESSSVKASPGNIRRADFTLRIPREKADEFINGAEGLGSVTYRNESVEDVTLQYSDTEGRIKTLRLEQERLWQLMAQADTIDAIVALNERLSEISSELDRYETRLKGISNQVDYTTVYLSMTEVEGFSPQKEDGIFTRMLKGMDENLRWVGNFIKEALITIVSILPTLTLLALLGIVMFFAGRAFGRARRRKEEEKNAKVLDNFVKEETRKTSEEVKTSGEEEAKESETAEAKKVTEPAEEVSAENIEAEPGIQNAETEGVIQNAEAETELDSETAEAKEGDNV